MYNTFLESPIGILRIASFKDKINIIEFVDKKDKEIINSLLNEAILQLKEYFNGERKEFNLPIEMRGTDFEIKVWEIIKKIPYGKKITYKDIALLIGGIKYSRAVGNACNKNRLAIIIPCHRVIGVNNKLVGYSSGIEKKKWLLDFELKNSININ